MLNRNFVWGLSMFVSCLTGPYSLCFGGELFPGYIVSGPYSGPIQFQVENERYQYLTAASYDNPKPKADWQFSLTPAELLTKLLPSVNPATFDAVVVTTLKAGDYSMGRVQVIQFNDDGTRPSPNIDLFVTNGQEFRSSFTTPSLDIPGFIQSWTWNLNEKGQFLFASNRQTFLYDFETDMTDVLPALGIGSNEYLLANGIANAGPVVGDALAWDTEGKYLRHPFRYSGGIMTDLNDLVQLNDELLLVNAYDLTETGEIIARMQNTWSGQEDWVKLTPAMVPEPSSLIIGLTGILAASAWCRRRSRRPIYD